MIFEPVIFSLVAATATTLAGFLAERLGSKQIKEKQLAAKQAETIVEAIKSEEGARRAEAIKLVLEKLPERNDAVQILHTLNQVLSEIPARSTSVSEHDAIEDLINGYHAQALSQASVQFWFSLAAATVGFALIIYSAVHTKTDGLIQIANAFPGVVMDAVAYLFFQQASATRQRATDLYDRLRNDKRTNEAVQIVESIQDDRVKSYIQAQMALHLTGLQSLPIDLASLYRDSSGTIKSAKPKVKPVS
jgi:hypothetical protein